MDRAEEGVADQSQAPDVLETAPEDEPVKSLLFPAVWSQQALEAGGKIHIAAVFPDLCEDFAADQNDDFARQLRRNHVEFVFGGESSSLIRSCWTMSEKSIQMQNSMGAQSGMGRAYRLNYTVARSESRARMYATPKYAGQR